jgi:hypothetical protein
MTFKIDAIKYILLINFPYDIHRTCRQKITSEIRSGTFVQTKSSYAHGFFLFMKYHFSNTDTATPPPFATFQFTTVLLVISISFTS